MRAGDSLTIETDSVRLDSEHLPDKPDLSAGQYAMIAFTDTGHGIVEDQAQIRDIASKVLHDMGCEVHSFPDAENALEYIDAGPEVDLLFTDIVTGSSLDGIGLAALAKGVRPAMKVIFTSGYTRSGPFARKLPAEGNYHFVAKPWLRHSIAAAMAQAFSSGGGMVTAADDGWNDSSSTAMAG